MAAIPADLRARFPALRHGVYMDTAARGLVSVAVRRAVDEYLDARMDTGGDKPAMFATVERLRARYATLIGAAPEEIAIVKNVSEGLNAVAAALPWAAGDNVVLCPELEHPNNVYPWLNLARRRGIEVRSVAARDGQLPVPALVEAIDDRTRVVSVSMVTFTPGLRADVATLGRACRARDVLLLGDGVQWVGVLHTDVERLAIDALAVSTQKGLLGLYGLGLLYVRRAWAERLAPVYLARFGVDLGAAHEATRGSADFRYAPAARRFDLGNFNFLAAAACARSLDLLHEVGTPAIEAHVTRLAHRLAGGLLELGLPVAGGAPGPHLGSIVGVGRLGAGGHDTTDDPDARALHEALAAAGVKHSLRQGLVRLSLHLYNDDADVTRVLEVARRSAQRRLRIA